LYCPCNSPPTANNSKEIFSKGYEGTPLAVTRTIDEIMTSEVELNDLVVSKLHGQDLALLVERQRDINTERI
jgi:hypothetical protein